MLVLSSVKDIFEFCIVLTTGLPAPMEIPEAPMMMPLAFTKDPYWLATRPLAVMIPVVVSSSSFLRNASATLTVRVSPTMALVAFVPPAIVRVSPGVMPVDPLSPATVVSDTTKSSVPSLSS